MDEHEAKHIEQQIANEREKLEEAKPGTGDKTQEEIVEEVKRDALAEEKPLTPEEEAALTAEAERFDREETEAIQSGREQQEGLPPEARGPDSGGVVESGREAAPEERAAPEGEQAAPAGANEPVVDEPVHLHQIDKIIF